MDGVLTNGVVIVINAIAYALVFILYYRKQTQFNIGCLILLTFMVSSAFSIYFYWNSNYYQYENPRSITLSSMSYLFGLIMISIIPILRYRSENITAITVPRVDILGAISIFTCLVSVLPIIENLQRCIQSISDPLYLAKVYEMRAIGVELTENALSDWGGKFNYMNIMLKSVAPLLLFYEVLRPKKRPLLLIGLGLATFNPIFSAYASAERVTIVNHLMYLMFVYFLFNNMIETRTRKIIKMVMAAALTIIFLAAAAITIVRYNYSAADDDDSSLLTWVSLYAGEGMLNFSADMWNIRQHTEGDNSFAFVKHYAGMKTFKINLERRAYWAPRTGIRSEVFYTYVGDIYSDLGFLGTPVFFVFASFLVYLLVPSYHIVTFHSLIILSIWYKVCFLGFTYFQFKTYEAQFEIFYMLVLYLIIKFASNNSVVVQKSSLGVK